MFPEHDGHDVYHVVADVRRPRATFDRIHSSIEQRADRFRILWQRTQRCFVHDANLFDIAQKYGDVLSTDETVSALQALNH